MIGGGNTAVEEALFLTNFATKVTVVHRRDAFRAERILQDRLFKQPEDRGDLEQRASRMSAARENPRKVAGARDPATSRPARVTEHRADGVFIAIGHSPATELFAAQVEMKPSGYIKTAPLLDRNLGAGRVRGRRCDRRRLSPGRDRRRHGLHGGAGGRAFPRRASRGTASPPNRPPIPQQSGIRIVTPEWRIPGSRARRAQQTRGISHSATSIDHGLG